MMRRLIVMVILQLFIVVPVVPAASLLNIPGVQNGAMIIRDRNGIPHIFAINEHDLILLQGYVRHAEHLRWDIQACEAFLPNIPADCGHLQDAIHSLYVQEHVP